MIYKLFHAGCPDCGGPNVEEIEGPGGTRYYCRDCKSWF